MAAGAEAEGEQPAAEQPGSQPAAEVGAGEAGSSGEAAAAVAAAARRHLGLQGSVQQRRSFGSNRQLQGQAGRRARNGHPAGSLARRCAAVQPDRVALTGRLLLLLLQECQSLAAVSLQQFSADGGRRCTGHGQLAQRTRPQPLGQPVLLRRTSARPPAAPARPPAAACSVPSQRAGKVIAHLWALQQDARSRQAATRPALQRLAAK